MGFVKEFREFSLRGNVIDLAVGIIIGGAFGLIVNSLVEDIIMPLIGIVFNSEFSNLYIPLADGIKEGMTLEEARAIGPVFAWGNFVTVVINFIILAFVIFLIIRSINSLRKKQAEKEEVAPAAPTTTEKLLEEIRDAINQRGRV